MLIDCDSCAVRNLACGDCVVTVLLGMPSAADPAQDEHVPVTRVELDTPERRALAVLAAQGLVPPLRLVPRAEGAPEDDDTDRTDHSTDHTAGDDAQAAAG